MARSQSALGYLGKLQAKNTSDYSRARVYKFYNYLMSPKVPECQLCT